METIPPVKFIAKEELPSPTIFTIFSAIA